MILQYSTADVKERARDGARVLPVYMGKARGVRLMRHLWRHVRIIIIVIIGLARLSCVLACPSPLRGGWMDVYITIWFRGRTRAGQRARTKIDERRDEGELDIGLAGGRALSASSQKLSALVPFGNGCYERQKEGLCPKLEPPRRKEGWRVDTQVLAGALLRPCTPSCHIWHATQVVPHTYPMPSHALLQAASEGAYLGF